MYERLLIGDPRRLWIRYAVAITIIVALIGLSHLAQVRTTREARLDAQVINESGRQRMLSQRILHLAAEYQATGSTDAVSRLADAVDLFETSHDRLIGLDTLSNRAHLHYFGEPALNLATRRYIATARQAIAAPPGSEVGDAALRSLREQGTVALLTGLNEAVSIFEADANDRTARMTAIQNVSLAAAILVLLTEAVLIFWPAQVSVSRTLARLRSQKEEIARQNDRLQEMTRRLTHSAWHDALTGLANRKKLYEELALRLASPDDTGSRLCVMHLDLDCFKEINDTLGHAAGDRVLRSAAETMRLHVRQGDLVARTGGDEFVLVIALPAEGAEARAQELAHALIARLSQPMTLDGQTCHPGASVGIAFARPRGDEVARLIADADLALYAAKRAGRGQAMFFDPEMRDGIERRQLLVRDIDRALREGEFVAYLQPQIAFDDGRVVGFEALARWSHPERGIVAPDDFIHLAEEVGAIDAIDEQVTLKAIDALVRLRDRGWSAARVAVNCSARTLRRDDFVERLLRSLRHRGLGPADVVIEVVESTLIRGSGDPAVGAVRMLAAAGFEIQLDGFGTGYASMANLAILDIAGLKVDRSLVATLDDPRTAQVVRAIVGIARGMELSLVAEGVETAQQFAVLKRLGCDVAQGFGIAAPLPAERIAGWLGEYGAPQELIGGRSPPAVGPGPRRDRAVTVARRPACPFRIAAALERRRRPPMLDRSEARRRIDPDRRPARSDAARPDPDGVEIGPTDLAFAEWEEAGLDLPDLPRMRAWRHGRIVAELARRDLAGVLIFDPLNIRYATDTTNMQVWNMHNPFRACLVAADGHVVLWDYRGLHFLSAFNPLVAEVRGGASMFYFATGERTDAAAFRFAAEVADLLAAHAPGGRLAVDKIAIEGLDALRAVGIAIVPGEPVMERVRAVKGPDDIAAMTCAVHACERAMAAMTEAARPGLTEAEIWAVLHAENIRRGGEWIETRLLTSGPRTNPWFQECGPRRTRPNEIVAYDTDMVGCFGMCADLSRTFWLGPDDPPAALVDDFRLAREHLDANIALFRRGAAISDIVAAAHVLPASYQAQKYSCLAHGIGLCDEWPHIDHPDHYDPRAFEAEILPGMCFCVEALVSREGGDWSVKLEDQIVVGEDGPVNLTRAPFDRALAGVV